MQSDAVTPAAYLEDLPADWRGDTVRAVRAMILGADPELTESMHHRMLGYGRGDDYVLHLNAQRQYVSLYVGDAASLDPDGDLLDGFDVGTGCVRLKRSTDLTAGAAGAVGELIARAIDRWHRGESVHC